MDVVLVTLNCAKRHISIAAAQDLIETALDRSRAPDALLIALQETAPIMDSMLGDISGYTASIELAVTAASKTLYGSSTEGLSMLEYIADSRCGGTCLLLFSRHVLEPPVEARLSTGYGWSSLKGAAALKFELPGGMIVKAASCHLPAGEGEAATKERNQVASLIFGSLDFGNGEQLINNAPNEHVFILGDLNYRGLKANDGDDGENLMAHPDVSVSELTHNIRDSLAGERAKSDVFGGLEEAEIKFPPTYKYFPESSTLNWKRVPSWCDRIMYSQQGCTPSVYDSFMSFEESDHKPVFLRATLFECDPPEYWPETTDLPDYAKTITPAVDIGVGLAMFLGTKNLGRTALALVVISILYMML